MYKKLTKFIRDNVDDISWRWCDIVEDYYPHLSKQEIFRKFRASHLLMVRAIREKDFEYILKPVRDDFREWILLKHRFQDLVNLEAVYTLMLQEYIESYTGLSDSDKKGMLHIIKVLRDSDLIDDLHNVYVGEQEKLFSRQIDELNVLNEISGKGEYGDDQLNEVDEDSDGEIRTTGHKIQEVIKEALEEAMTVLGATDGVLAFLTDNEEWVEANFLESAGHQDSQQVISDIKEKSPHEFDPTILTAFSHVVDKAVLRNYWNPDNIRDLMNNTCPTCRFQDTLETKAKGAIECPILATLKVSNFLCHHFSDNQGNRGLFLISRSIPPPLSPEDLKFVSTLSGTVLTIIENYLLYSQLNKLAITDGLTGLFNHRHFQGILKNEIDRYRRHEQVGLGLLILDIDHFKKFNDTYGHQVGDEVLKTVARTIRRTVRTIDSVARYGGEEMAVILPLTNNEGGSLVAEKIRSNIENQTLPVEGRKVNITVSIGVASFPDCADTQPSLIQAADEAMYRAKENGRNQVQVAEPRTSEVT